ncbi:ARM repeat-containing protein [Flagelloscypha sp. PMI_526]|nr:ARM repeat-containing protein [Flagelloscypha sp. PMI_526]
MDQHRKRVELKAENDTITKDEIAKLDSSLKRHTALIKRMKQSLAADYRDQIFKDISSLSLEKYIEELATAAVEGIVRCKSEKDVWSAVQIISALHRRFPKEFTPGLVSSLAAALAPASREALAGLPQDQREKEDALRVTRQRPVLRVCCELALVGVIRDAPGRSGGEWIMKRMKELLSNDPSLSSLPLLTTFLKTYALPFLGISPPTSNKQINAQTEPGTLSFSTQSSVDGPFPELAKTDDYLVEQETRDRFKKMCEGYFDNVAKKLLIEHQRLQEQDRRNHEAYIRSGEIFEDRQQAYEKMTRGYEKLLSSCQSLSELLYLSMPVLPTTSHKTDSIQIGTNTGSSIIGEISEEFISGGSQWEDEEEKRFFEDILELKDFVPRGVLGLENDDGDAGDDKVHSSQQQNEKREEMEQEEVRKLEEELERLEVNGVTATESALQDADMDHNEAPTPTPGTPKAVTPPLSPTLVAQGPTQLLTALLARLPECTNRAMIDQAAVDFAFLNSKAARKRLVKFLGQVPKNRTDLLPHYSRLVAILNRYMPDVGTDLVAVLDEEFRYLQRKKNVVKELSEVRLKNITFFSNLTKFGVVPTHLILHIYKVCLDDFSGTNVDNIALLLEGCGRFLLRGEETRQRFATMLELMRRKQAMQHFDQRQSLMLENAYYQCNPPERAPIEEKKRLPVEMFIHHLLYDVLAKRTIDKVLKLIRKLDWNGTGEGTKDEEGKPQPSADIPRLLHKAFVKPWKIQYGNIPLLAMLAYDLQRYHPSFSVGIVDQVLEDVRFGMEQNVYNLNQRRVSTMKYLGELYIYRMFSSSIIFDTLWSLVTFGHPEGRPHPRQAVPLDMPDDFFRIRLVCVLLDTCGMCFDRGTQRKKLDNFLVFFQYYIHCKHALPMDIDFMLSDSLEAVRPKFSLVKTIEEAATAVDDMLNSAFQEAEIGDEGDESGDESGGEEGGEGRRDDDGTDKDEDDDEDTTSPYSPVGERAPSPDQDVVLSGNLGNQEILGPSEEADAEFAKELAKMVTDVSAETRKVDKKTAQALWDAAVLPGVVRKKRGGEEADEEEGSSPLANGLMNFTVLSRKGNKQQARQIAIPSGSALAVHTRSAQLQDKVEQQELKRLVLDYEQREEAEELKAIEARNRAGAVKIRYVG